MARRTGVSLKATHAAGTQPARAIDHRSTPRRGWLSGLVCALLIGVLVAQITEFVNPDWAAYAVLFENGGGWLADQGRDPLFLLVIQLAVQALGVDGYEDFRVFLGIFFTLATLLLASGYILPFSNGKPFWLAMVLAVLVFTGSRFTIQIREGLAMILVLLAIRQIWSVSDGHGRHWLAVFFMCAATLVHGGTAFIAATMLMALAIASQIGQSPITRQTWRVWWFAAAVAGILGTVLLLNFGVASGLVQTLDDGRESFDRSSTLKYLYWGMVALCMLSIASATGRCIDHRSTPQALRAFLGIAAYIVLPAVTASAITQLALDSSGVIIAATSRLLQMVSNLLILILAARRQMPLSVGLITLFFFADQVRTAIDSISGHLALLDL